MNRAFAILLLAALPTHAAEVQVIGVAASHSAAKVYFQPFPGAADFRIYDITKPNDVKYAGLIHLTADSGCSGDHAYDLTNSSCYRQLATNTDGTLAFPFVAEGGYGNGGASKGPTGYDGPAYFIDYNGLGDGQPHTLIVEAVDALGPVPKCNLYRETDITIYVPLCPMAPMPDMSMMLGGNKGATDDGKISTNGQGPYTNNPHVIAASRPFIVQANRGYTPIIPGASQAFLDTFENSEAASITLQPGDCPHYTSDRGAVGGKEWTLNAGTAKSWRIIGREINCTSTTPFIMSDHLMDVLGDGSNMIYGSISFTPDQTFQLNGGILHLTQEVDDVMFGDRWMDFNIAPAGDPLVHWNHLDKSLNASNEWVFMMNFGQFSPSGAQLLVSNGPGGNIDVPGAPVNAFTGDGNDLHTGGVRDQYDPRTLASNGLGFDTKRRWDFFMSATHAALFIDGRMVAQGDIPASKGAWLTGPLKVYFSHYNYHSEAGWKSMLTSGQGYPPGLCNLPMLAYWFNDPVNGVTAGAQVTAITNGTRIPANGYGLNNCRQSRPPGYGFRDTDERHWDNMGASVIPANFALPSDFSVLAALVQPPAALPPVFSGTTPPAPVNCVASPAPPAWGPDTLVSAVTNPDGSKTQTWQHTRTVVTPPSNGGAACPALIEVWTVQIPAPPPASIQVCSDEVLVASGAMKLKTCAYLTPVN